MYPALSIKLLHVTSYDRELQFILNIKKARYLCRSRASIKLFFLHLASDRHLNSDGGDDNGNVLSCIIHG